MALDPRYRAIGFDMDGTFINSTIDYSKLNRVVSDEMTSAGIPEEVIDRTVVGVSEMTSCVSWMKANGMADEVCRIQKKIHERSTDIELEYAHLAKPFEGAVEVMELLKSKGYKVGLLTRGGRRYAEYVLGRNSLLDEFDAIVARDDFPEEETKPSPKAMENLANALGLKVNEILYVGDHKFDWFTARDSGAGFYGVTTGKFKEEDWYKTDKEIKILSSVKDLLGII